jgi:hypothetical protein
MSTAIATTAPAGLRGAGSKPSIGRLTAGELRKMTDTRAGFWLMLSVLALSVATVAILGFAADTEDHVLRVMLSVAITPPSILLPIVGILLVTSEWSQRTAMVTFALVPQRSRVLAAKLLAGVALALVAFAVSLAIALIGAAVFPQPPVGGWELSAGLLGQMALILVISMLGGLAFGAVLLSSAPAIVLYFVLPTAWAALGSISWLEGSARWLDQTRTMGPMSEELLSATQWARVGTSLALWLLLPLLVGWWRILRSEAR